MKPRTFATQTETEKTMVNKIYSGVPLKLDK